MNKYIYKGEWVSGSYYKLYTAVSHNGVYYVSTSIQSGGYEPPNSEYWNALPSYAYKSKTTYLKNYEIIKALDDNINEVVDFNDKGLYQFPRKSNMGRGFYLEYQGEGLEYNGEALTYNEMLDDYTHFRKMGVSMVYDAAVAFYEANKDSMPNITGIYIMQGGRKINVVTQGFSVAAVEAVGFGFKTNVTREANPIEATFEYLQNMKLGTSSEDVAFPIIGGDDYRLFPVMKISRNRLTNNGKKNFIFRMEEDSISQGLVSTKNDDILFKFLKRSDNTELDAGSAFQYDTLLSQRAISPPLLAAWQKEYFNNIRTDKFCIYTPDILINKGITISSNLFIKSVQKIKFNLLDRNNYLKLTNSTNRGIEKKYSNLFMNGKVDVLNFPPETPIYSIYRENNDNPNEPDIEKDFRFFDYYKTEYNDIAGSVINASTYIVNTNTVKGMYGFSTRMKSIIEVFGFDYKSGATDSLSSTIERFISSSRIELFESGILLNRYRWDASDNVIGDLVNDHTEIFESEDNYYKIFPFGYRNKLCIFPPDNFSGGDSHVSIPQILTNLSMQSLPYIGVKLPARHKYSSKASLTTGEPSYQDLHNAIVNLCIYEDDKKYKEAIHNEFNMLSETYKVIEYTDTWNIEGENLVLNSDKYISNSNYLVARYEMSENWIEGETYTIAIKGKLNAGQSFLICRDLGWVGVAEILSDNGINVATFECEPKDERGGVAENIISIYSAHKSNVKHGHIEWIKLEKGDTFTGYSKAPQDEILLRGDIFSQKTFMRVIRWSDLPDVMTTPKEGWDWSYSWKYGQAINVYLQSRVNTYLRSVTHDSTYINDALRDYDNREDAIANFIWKNTSMRYLNESWRTNDGYNVTHGLLELAAFNETVMKRTYEAKNRIYASNVHVGGAIADAYREIPAGQYRDYNFDRGEIVALAKFNNMLFSVQRSALLQHYTSKQLTQSEDSSTIITGNKEVLSDQFRELATYGSQHRDSIVEGLMGIYGIDWNREKIWRITQKHGEQGHVFYVAEDLATSKQAYDIFKLIKTDNKPLDETVYDKGGIVSTYDDENKLVLFTFHILDRETTKRYTLGFSEEIDNFIGFYDYTNEIYMKLDGRLFGYSSSNKDIEDDEVVSNELWEHNANDDYLKLYDVDKPLELEFIVNCASEQQNASQFEKEFMSHLITSSHLKFDLVEWETEWQESTKNPFINDNEFWSNPEYREHTWRVPIIYNDKSSVTGPLGSEEFKTFESDSAMRGQWLKVKLKYVPLSSQEDIQFYIKNVITNFIISYS